MNTNAWDVFVILFYLSFLLLFFAGTAYLVQVYGWSSWWFLFTVIFAGSVRVKTGGR